MPVDVSILIVNFNTCAALDACLASIAEATRVEHEVVVVDNASADGSVAMIEARHPEVTLVANLRNVGFAAATNQAARLAHGRYLLLLNPDTRVLPGAIERLVRFLDRHPEAGIVAPRNLDGAGIVRHNCHPFENACIFFWQGTGVGLLRLARQLLCQPPRWRVESDELQEVEAVKGCSLMIDAMFYRQLDGLDERFFMYCEDTDLCYRAHQAGRRIFYIPEAVIVHYGGQSTPGHEPLLNGMIGRHLLRSRYLYVRKHQGETAARLLRVAYALAGALIMSGSLLLSPPTKSAHFLRHGRLLLTTSLPAREGQP